MRPLSIFLFAILLLPMVALAGDMTSGSFEVLAPVFHSNGFASSQNFRLFGSLGQTLQGVSNSGTFQLKSGFQYYAAPSAAPAPSPTPTPTPGTGGGPVLEIFKYLYRLIVPCTRGDLNCDGRVDLVDAAILFYWWGQPLRQPQVASALETVTATGRPSPDLNKDASVDIFDLSILLSNWTD